MINKIKAFAEKYDMLPKGVILAAVSGGADSMCLLSVLHELSKAMDFKVEAAHYNHNLRGEESDRDETFVRSECERMNIPCHVGSGDVSLWAKSHGCGLEEAGRKLRYEFFYKTAKEIGASRIATAHNADDNCETVIMNITRGTGLKGLCGIPPKRDMIVRPLLILTRSEIEEYLSNNSIPHIEDSSNSSDDYTRNKLRHHVIPVLKEINPDFSGAVANLVRLVSEDRDYLEAQADKLINDMEYISVSAIASQPDAIASRVIRKLSKTELSSQQTEAVLQLIRSPSPSGKISLPGCTAIREYDTLRFVTETEAAVGFEPFLLYDGFDAHIPALGVRFQCKKEIYSEIIHKSFNSLLFKIEGLCGKIAVRPRASGDQMTISGRNVTKSLKKLMIENRIPQSKRELIPVFCDDEGVIGVMGMGQDPRTVPNTGDEVLIITIVE